MIIFVLGLFCIFLGLAGGWWGQKFYVPSMAKVCPECEYKLTHKTEKCPKCQASLLGRRLGRRPDQRGRIFAFAATVGTTGVLMLIVGTMLSMKK
jgi:hypothetical protein